MKKFFKSTFLCLLTFVLFLCPVTDIHAIENNVRIVSSEAVALSENDIYYIRNYNSNLYLDVEAPGYTNLIQHSFMGGNNQRFIYRNNTLRTVYNSKYVSTGAEYATDFQRAVVSTKSESISLSVNTDGTYCILRKDGNTWRALDAYNSSKSSVVVGWADYTASASQKWVLEDGNQAEIARGTYYIMNANSGKYLSLDESTGELMQNSLTSGNNQKWEIIKTSSGNYQIKTKSTKYPGYINYKYTTDNFGVVSSSSMNIDIFENSNGTYKLHMPNYSYCLVIRYASLNNLAKAIWYPYNNTYNEQWMFVKA